MEEKFPYTIQEVHQLSNPAFEPKSDGELSVVYTKPVKFMTAASKEVLFELTSTHATTPDTFSVASNIIVTPGDYNEPIYFMLAEVEDDFYCGEGFSTTDEGYSVLSGVAKIKCTGTDAGKITMTAASQFKVIVMTEFDKMNSKNSVEFLVTVTPYVAPGN